MFIPDIEKKLDTVFNEFTSFYIPSEYQKRFRERAYIAGGCIYALANDQQPKDYDFFVSDSELVSLLMYKFAEQKDIYTLSNYAVTISDSKCQIIVKYIGTPEDVVGQFDFKHNMFYFQNGKIVGLVEPSFLKTKRLVFNEERARDIAGILLRIPRFISRGMSISNTQMASIIQKLCNNFDENEKRILDEKSTYDSKHTKHEESYLAIQVTPMNHLRYPAPQVSQSQSISAAKGGFSLPF